MTPRQAALSVATGVLVCLMVLVESLPAQQSAVPFTAPDIRDTAGLKGPVQPVFFRHDVHAGQYQLDCKYCHYTAEYAPTPGVPGMKTCMGCHLIAGAAIPEVQKVRQIATSNQVVEWVKVNHLPPFVHFPHMRHLKGETALKAQITCQTCHGQIERMPRVYQVPSLKMGWCLDCHKKNKVTTDCSACHY